MASSNIDRVELRQRILYYHEQSKSPVETTRRIWGEYGRNVLPFSVCKMWFNKFESRKYNLKSSDATRSELKALLNENSSLSPKQLAWKLGISPRTVWQHLKVLKENRQIERQVTTRNKVEALYKENPSQTHQEIADRILEFVDKQYRNI
ncbi:uncharacterized protein LOC113562956 [Ooceraea biroi]|uniref:Uncharacterized protein n=1 Tax=Ooceraea biroi TaxID=2015173 RepID=A0A026WXF7_OOCBI|nr:uncharacterized protein LOC113562956 [Ooceraea biroi]EZA60513.1 hypothetical protein X777_13602 [Ooceraea biroi]